MRTKDQASLCVAFDFYPTFPGSWKREKDHRIMTQPNFGKRIRLEAAPTATDQAQEDPKP
ncbi:MAG: hypothetical protein AB7Q16_05865 [Vicinamibacterales bacterium]